MTPVEPNTPPSPWYDMLSIHNNNIIPNDTWNNQYEDETPPKYRHIDRVSKSSSGEDQVVRMFSRKLNDIQI